MTMVFCKEYTPLQSQSKGEKAVEDGKEEVCAVSLCSIVQGTTYCLLPHGPKSKDDGQPKDWLIQHSQSSGQS
jgi:hypothetical protein